MANQLAVIEQNLKLQLPTLAQALPKRGNLDPERLMRTAIMAAERNEDILNCTMPSIVASTVTAAVIGLEVDGVTGQGFLVPFRDKGIAKCQFMMGYKGYPTIAARSGLTIASGVAREGDHFEFDEGAGHISHIRSLAPNAGRRIIASWAKMAGRGFSPVVKILTRDDIDELRKRSKGASGRGGFSPWNDEQGPGFAAMAEKSAMRRINRNMPVIAADDGYQRAAALEGSQEGGNLAWLRHDGQLIEERVRQAEPMAIGDRPFEPRWTMADGTDRVWKTPNDWAKTLVQQLPNASDEALQSAIDRNTANLKAMLDAGHVDQHMAVIRIFVERGIFPSSQEGAGEVIDQ